MATSEQHHEISIQFLQHAEDEFRKGDFLQASEKAWGAVSHYVNSVARKRSWPMGSHRQLIENANRLINLDAGQANHKRRLLRSIEALHANFYEAFLDEDSVREGIEDAKELIRTLVDDGPDEEQATTV